jgi:endonuclease/exonuclease/phosphatase family metal-dependent hydrolase
MVNSMRQLYEDMDDCANQALSLDTLGKMHRWGSDADYHSGAPERPTPLSLKELCRRHERRLKFLWLNTYLMPTIKLDNPLKKVTLHEGTPANISRAQEIGQTIKQEGFDVAALCEVWTDGSKTTILNNWTPPTVWIKGPGKSIMQFKMEIPGVTEIAKWLGVDASVKVFTVEIMSSGLFTLLPGSFALLGQNSEVFTNEGVKIRDADAWSNKGILMVTVETGYGSKIEFYSTHIISGNDFPISSAEREDVVADVARAQIDQLVSFITKNNNPSNLIVVAGDFNIDGAGLHYEYLRKRMEDDLGLEDAWVRYSHDKYGVHLYGTMSNNTFPDDAVNSKYIRDCTDSDKCPGDQMGDSTRNDYVFVQKPTSKHLIGVEVSRPRRRHFKRDPSAEGYAVIPTVSDHVGVEMKLFIADKHILAQPTSGGPNK